MTETHQMSYDTNHGNPELIEILPTEYIAWLSPAAGRLYRSLHNGMSYKRTTRLNLSDHIVSKRARVPVSELQAAKDELVLEELMDMSPNGDRTQYEYREPSLS